MGRSGLAGELSSLICGALLPRTGRCRPLTRKVRVEIGRSEPDVTPKPDVRQPISLAGVVDPLDVNLELLRDLCRGEQVEVERWVRHGRKTYRRQSHIQWRLVGHPGATPLVVAPVGPDDVSLAPSERSHIKPNPGVSVEPSGHDGGVDALELIVDEGRSANAGRFFQLGHDLLALLDELSDVPVLWQITNLRTGSALASVAPPANHPEEMRVLRLAHSSLRAVQEGAGLSDSWSPDAVRVAHRFVEHGQRADGEADWVPPRLRLVVEHGQSPPAVALTAELGDRLADLQPFERRMPGSVRGELVGVNVSRGNRASLRLSNKRIVRVGFESALRDELKDAMYRQVELTGLVKQDAEGRVFHVRADRVTVLTKPAVSWSELFGIDPDYLEGASAEDWLGANRGEA